MEDHVSGVVVKADDLLAFCRATLARAGLDDPGAEIVARSLVEADLRGISTHGVVRLWLYERRVRAGLIRPNPDMEFVRTGPATATLRGPRGRASRGSSGHERGDRPRWPDGRWLRRGHGE
jgi:ureidoglycolate dehydrogenase (NAD+)